MLPRTFQQARGGIPAARFGSCSCRAAFLLNPAACRLMGRLTVRPAFPAEPLILPYAS